MAMVAFAWPTILMGWALRSNTGSTNSQFFSLEIGVLFHSFPDSTLDKVAVWA
jgi:hypothetical protein